MSPVTTIIKYIDICCLSLSSASLLYLFLKCRILSYLNPEREIYSLFAQAAVDNAQPMLWIQSGVGIDFHSLCVI